MNNKLKWVDIANFFTFMTFGYFALWFFLDGDRVTGMKLVNVRFLSYFFLWVAILSVWNLWNIRSMALKNYKLKERLNALAGQWAQHNRILHNGE